ncbi:MAG: zinc-binding alcohol dehydrogenase family protein [Zavarzinella sp.]
MKTLVLEEPKKFRIQQTTQPVHPGPGDALVRVHRVGICGTDVSGYLGKMPFMTYPRIMGHELGVEVMQLGDGVSHIQVGDRCSVEPYINCGHCMQCRTGKPNCCKNLQVLGVHTDGGMRPFVIVPARKLHPSSKLSLAQLALVETLAIGCHAVDRGELQPKQQILIVGAGPIGLSVLEFARVAGAEITVLDMNPARLEFCRTVMKADHVVELRDLPTTLKELESITGGELFSCVFDATGNAGAMATSFQYVSFGGRMIYVGIVSTDVALPDPLFHRREMTLMGTRNALPGDFPRIIQLIEAGRIDTQPWISHEVIFEDVPNRFPDLMKPDAQVIKAMITVGD